MFLKKSAEKKILIVR